jgi:hypothetical protein
MPVAYWFSGLLTTVLPAILKNPAEFLEMQQPDSNRQIDQTDPTKAVKLLQIARNY